MKKTTGFAVHEQDLVFKIKRDHSFQHAFENGFLQGSFTEGRRNAVADDGSDRISFFDKIPYFMKRGSGIERFRFSRDERLEVFGKFYQGIFQSPCEQNKRSRSASQQYEPADNGDKPGG